MKRLKEVLQSGRPALGTSILYESPEMVESLSGQGWDWIWLDGQHALRQHTWLEHIRVCQIIDAAPVLRVPSTTGHLISHGLDLGAWDIMVPMVESPGQARAVVDAAHFPPLGRRSAVGTRPLALYGWEYIEMAQRWVTVIVQIETRSGMENLDQIAAVPGVDALFIGCGDLCLSLGIPLSEKNASGEIQDAIEQVGLAARHYGKHAGIICEPEEVPLRRAQGYSFFALNLAVDTVSDQMRRVMLRTREELALGLTPIEGERI